MQRQVPESLHQSVPPQRAGYISNHVCPVIEAAFNSQPAMDSTTRLALLFVLLPLGYYLIPYFHDPLKLRRFPAASSVAALSDSWLFVAARRGHRYTSVHEAHKALGPIVRLQPNHVSIADPAALPIVYGHGNGFLKSDYYDVFVSLTRGLFNTRDRAEHTRKRKTVSHVFSTRSISQFEPFIHANLELLVSQWERLCNEAVAGKATLNALSWFNYLAFDIIADLTFGSPFGMLRSGRDEAVVKDPATGKITTAAAIEVLNRRGEVSGTLGCMPWIKPYARYLPDPFFAQGAQAVSDLAGIAVARVAERLDAGVGADREDLLRRLMEGRDAAGRPLGRKETEAEALTMLIAGSDTTSNTLCALLFHVLRTPGVQQTLQAELDAALPADCTVPTFSAVRDLPYLKAVISETLRIHSTSSLGLPRVVPAGGATVCGHFFEAGTVLSVPAYSLHHSAQIWGDPAAFKPERWIEPQTELQKASFVPFSVGPRACVGRNVAEMEMAVAVATTFKSFTWKFADGERQGDEGRGLETREGFLRKPLGLQVVVEKRTGA
ncbi:cytochrome P450 [Geopyxis carbonaria]|nr:cytochrome P450 [Geopyxis carbonaria]